ncbi:glycosyltransferase family 2 protein [Geomonas sp. Red32]|uniref:glycosyltransferase family 2 protein n=1 Tax=Geomonas sp. Red32 TaxID=2912856 RepID=UPI00202CACDD|nr:glycosyltransferase family 2 protein [Geomonas sp. Red32]MCM0083596.1 glycosyltransferase family 2 protein [Geomonas sp. Red32]
MQTPKVYVVILNWNGWADTIECLESLLRSTYRNFQVVVCDNSSSDGSVERIKAWAAGDLSLYLDRTNPLRGLSFPAVAKPLSCLHLRAGEGFGAGTGEGYPLVLIETGGNLGFAGGNNVGLRYALARDDFDFVWLLNNDTVVAPDALASMVESMAHRPDAGFCGAMLLDYSPPQAVQSYGGSTYNRWLAAPKSVGAGETLGPAIDEDTVSQGLDYVAGASMLVPKRLLVEIGLMCEDYFLYFEEIDWFQRARRRFRIAFSSRSRVYHKEGASIGSSSVAASRSKLSDFYLVRNKVLFTRKFFPLLLPVVILSTLVVAVNRIRRGQADRVGIVFKGVLEGIRG